MKYMRLLVIIELEVFFESFLELLHILIALEIHILVLDCAPKPLDEEKVHSRELFKKLPKISQILMIFRE